MRAQIVTKKSRNNNYFKKNYFKKEKRARFQLLKFSPRLRLKDFLLFTFFIFVITQSFLLFYFYSLHTQEQRAIDEYKEALKFILREGGGFNYSTCNEYIMPNNPQVASLAQQLKTPENAFLFVATRIAYRFKVTEDLLYPFVTLSKGFSNCVGQANLLVSLLIAQGIKEKNVWVVYGSIVLNKMRGNHAWVELYHNNRWIVLDSTMLTPYKGFGKYEKTQFYQDFKVVPVIRYNTRSKYFVSH